MDLFHLLCKANDKVVWYNKDNDDLSKGKFEKLKIVRLLSNLIRTFHEKTIFIYEVLPQSKLQGYWKNMKKDNVSFVRI